MVCIGGQLQGEGAVFAGLYRDGNVPQHMVGTKAFVPGFNSQHDQGHVIEALGAAYAAYNLVVAGPLGLPAEHTTVNTALNRPIKRNDLSKVVFYSIFWSCSHCNHRPGMVL